MFDRFFEFVAKRPRAILAVVILGALFFAGWIFLRVSITTKVNDLFYDRFRNPLAFIEEQMQNPRAMHITFAAPAGGSALSLDQLRLQDDLFAKIQEKWPVKVQSLTSVIDKRLHYELPDQPDYRVRDINTQGFLLKIIEDIWRASPLEFARLAGKGFSDHEAVNALAQLDYQKSTGFGFLIDENQIDLPQVPALQATVSLNESLSSADALRTQAEIARFAREYSAQLKVRTFSASLLLQEIDQRIRRNGPWIVLIMVLLLAVLLYSSFKSWFFTLMPLGVLTLMLFFTYGLLSLFWRQNFSFMAVIPIPLLLGQTIDNLIHFNERFREERETLDKHAALLMVFKTAGKAALITTVINMSAFLFDAFMPSLRTSREYELLLMIGIGLAFVMTYLAGAAALLLARKGIGVASSAGRSEGVASPATKGLLGMGLFARYSLGERLQDIKLVERLGLKRLRTLKRLRARFPKLGQQAKADREYHWFKYFYWQIETHRRGVVVVALLVLVFFGYQMTRLDHNYRTLSYMAPSFFSYDAYNFEQEHFKVYEPHYILIRGAVDDPKVLEVVKAVESKLSEIPQVEQFNGRANVESIKYLLSKYEVADSKASAAETSATETVDPKTPDGKQAKESRGATKKSKVTGPPTYVKGFPNDYKKQLDFLSQDERIINPVLLTSAKDYFPSVVHKNSEGAYDAMLVKFWPEIISSSMVEDIARQLEEIAQNYVDQFDVSVVGETLAFVRTGAVAEKRATRTGLLTVILIIILLSWLFRNFKAALVSILPILLGVTVGLGVLPVMDVEINVLNATIAILALGLGVDYSIQIMMRYKEELIKLREPREAMAEAFGHIAPSLGKASLMTSAGLIVLIGLLPLTGKFGVAAAISILISYVGAVTILPIVAVRWIKK